MCGEYVLTIVLTDLVKGSPPHVWRIQNIDFKNKEIFRITSTCVENTSKMTEQNPHQRDHLHMCGEYTALKDLSTSALGSPPHVWRILFLQMVEKPKPRITSTCVENTAKPYFSAVKRQDHLHMCGEYRFISF